jgi:hypothetical protein
MTWMTKLFGLGIATVGGVAVLRCIPRESRHRATRAVGDWMTKQMLNHMGRMMANLPEGAPPKLIASILPKLQDQNEQIIAMLREQNDLLRQQRQKTAA